MFVSLVEVLFFFDLWRVSLIFFHFLRMKDCHLKNYVTCGLVEWCSLQVFMACKWLKQQITDVCNTIYVMFDNIKAVKMYWKIVTVIWTTSQLNTYQTHKIARLIMKCTINQTFRDLKCSFRASLFHRSTCLPERPYTALYSSWWVELSPETCRVKPLRRINAIVASCWNYFTIKHDARNHKCMLFVVIAVYLELSLLGLN